jgi:hypothetical protein
MYYKWFYLLLHRAHVPPRNKSKTITVKGLFPKAEVIRGPHWKWKNDDGELMFSIVFMNRVKLIDK